MKRIILLFLLFGLATAAFAQNYGEVEQQINRSIQSNATEFDRLVALLENTTNERELAQLVNAFHNRQSQIRETQREIEEMINRPAARRLIDTKLAQLQDLMRSEQRLLERLNNLRN